MRCSDTFSCTELHIVTLEMEAIFGFMCGERNSIPYIFHSSIYMIIFIPRNKLQLRLPLNMTFFLWHIHQSYCQGIIYVYLTHSTDKCQSVTFLNNPHLSRN